MQKWYKLDNAAKLFPSVANTKNTSVYRVSAVMSEPVDIEILQHAADTVFVRFPMFMVKLRKGIFWNYLDAAVNGLKVEEERQYPCRDIDPIESNGYLFKILYFNNRISVEFFHALTDGYGAVEFLKSLLFYYLKYAGNDINPENLILLADDGVDNPEKEDSFNKHYKDAYYESVSGRKAYHIKGTPFERFGNNVVHGTMSASKLNNIAKQNNCTITSYLTALLIYSIYQTQLKDSEHNPPVVVAIPVNLRKAFPSESLRNFFGVVNIGVKVTETTSFDDLLVATREMLKQKTTKLNLQNIIYNNVALERNRATLFIPLFLKSLFVNAGFNSLGENKRTISLSNIGNIKLPQQMDEHIKQIEALVYPSNKSPMNCGICTVNDKLTITFTRNIAEADILQYFFSHLAQQDELEVNVYSNDWGDKNDVMRSLSSFG